MVEFRFVSVNNDCKNSNRKKNFLYKENKIWNCMVELTQLVHLFAWWTTITIFISFIVIQLPMIVFLSGIFQYNKSIEYNIGLFVCFVFGSIHLIVGPRSIHCTHMNMVCMNGYACIFAYHFGIFIISIHLSPAELCWVDIYRKYIIHFTIQFTVSLWQ